MVVRRFLPMVENTAVFEEHLPLFPAPVAPLFPPRPCNHPCRTICVCGADRYIYVKHPSWSLSVIDSEQDHVNINQKVSSSPPLLDFILLRDGWI